MNIEDIFSTLNDNFPSADNVNAEKFCSSHEFGTDDCIFDELDLPITAQEISEAVKELKKNSAGDKLLNDK